MDPIINTAAAALKAARERDWTQAYTGADLLTAYGDDTPRAVRAATWIWTDYLVSKLTEHVDVDVVDISYVSETAGPTDVVPAEVRWAGQVITARLAGNDTAYDQAIADIPTGEQARYLRTLLTAVVLTEATYNKAIEEAEPIIEQIRNANNN